MTITYTDINGIESPTGSQIKIIDIKESGNVYTYSCIYMTIQFFVQTVIISGVRELKPVESETVYKETFELFVTNNSYRKLSDLSVAPKEEALDENGNVKAGYKPEFDFFVDLFGHNIYNQSNKMYPFIAQAIVRKFY